jgi:predicted RNA-binding protein with PIN domain
VEAALAVARAGLTADPVVLPPPALRRYVNFSKLPARSLDAVARVVDGDDEFRARVAAAVDEAQVGRAGWLWLTRPEGWSADVAEIEAAATAQAADAAAQREERAATRKLAAAQAAVARAEADATGRLAELDAARADLAGERAARTVAEERVAELEALAADLTAARADLIRKLKDAEARLVDRGTEANVLKARLRALEADSRQRNAVDGEATAAPPHGAASAQASPPPSPPAVRPADAPPSSPVAPADSPATAGPGPGVGAPAPATDRPIPAAVTAEIARAAAGAAGLAEALSRLAHLLGDDRRRPAAPGAPRTAGSAPNVAPTPSDAAVPEVAATGSRPRRMPLALPGGMFDDTVEAAEHLLRTPGVVLVVDGYNVTMQGWPELSGADQRRRLVVALSDLAARTASQVEVVFDGAEVEPLPVPTPTRPLVRVRFSDPGVEADDVVIDLVCSIPAATPVIVASSDKRVREGARRFGANLLHARQLVAVLRR